MITNSDSGTNIEEVADRIYRISTPVTTGFGGFTFNQYLIQDDTSLLFHTGPKRMFPLVLEAVARVLLVSSLRYIAYSHFEADECGAMNEWLAAAPDAVPVCSRLGAMTSMNDFADRPPLAMGNGETLTLGHSHLTWMDAPHVPHGWDCGFMMESTTGTLLCGDLFTQPGSKLPAVTESDILEPSERMRAGMDYFAHGANTAGVLERFATCKPTTLACMHGSAWRGDGAALLRALSARLCDTVPNPVA